MQTGFNLKSQPHEAKDSTVRTKSRRCRGTAPLPCHGCRSTGGLVDFGGMEPSSTGMQGLQLNDPSLQSDLAKRHLDSDQDPSGLQSARVVPSILRGLSPGQSNACDLSVYATGHQNMTDPQRRACTGMRCISMHDHLCRRPSNPSGLQSARVVPSILRGLSPGQSNACDLSVYATGHQNMTDPQRRACTGMRCISMHDHLCRRPSNPSGLQSARVVPSILRGLSPGQSNACDLSVYATGHQNMTDPQRRACTGMRCISMHDHLCRRPSNPSGLQSARVVPSILRGLSPGQSNACDLSVYATGHQNMTDPQRRACTGMRCISMHDHLCRRPSNPSGLQSARVVPSILRGLSPGQSNACDLSVYATGHQNMTDPQRRACTGMRCISMHDHLCRRPSNPSGLQSARVVSSILRGLSPGQSNACDLSVYATGHQNMTDPQRRACTGMRCMSLHDHLCRRPSNPSGLQSARVDTCRRMKTDFRPDGKFEVFGLSSRITGRTSMCEPWACSAWLKGRTDSCRPTIWRPNVNTDHLLTPGFCLDRHLRGLLASAFVGKQEGKLSAMWTTHALQSLHQGELQHIPCCRNMSWWCFTDG